MSEVIVLDTHVWYWWISQDHLRLPSAVASAIATALSLDATLASVDGNFLAYPELTGRLLGAAI